MSDGHTQAAKDRERAFYAKLAAMPPHERIATHMLHDPRFNADIRAVVPEIERRLEEAAGEVHHRGTGVMDTRFTERASTKKGGG